jgi:N-formylglutamate amidohydrolase
MSESTATGSLPVSISRPVQAVLPIVIDSPHSGTAYPPDFGYSAPFELLRRGEDLFVERLYEHAPRFGATFIAANFPRAYIDPNRLLCDIDPELLDAPWPGEVAAGPKTALGIGLIWRRGARNDPFKGVEIIARYGRPAEKRHSLQIEIKRSCYADVALHVSNEGFGRMQRALAGMLAVLATHVRRECGLDA